MSDFTDLFDFIKENGDLSNDKVRLILVAMAEVGFSPIEEDQLLRLLHKRSAIGLTALRNEFAHIRIQHGIPPIDLGIAIAKDVLETQFEKGRFLKKVRGMGYYQYMLASWQEMSTAALRKRIMPIVVKYKPHFGKRPAISVANEVLSCIADLVELHDPNDAPKSVINTATHEIWLNGNGFYEPKPHNHESGLFSNLPDGYDPKAKCPLYVQTMLEMFASCTNPEDVFRHWNEFLGYIIQPDRFIDAVWFMIGKGENGKSTALKILMKLLGPVAYSCDIRDFSGDNFKYRALFNKLLLVDEDYKKGLVTNDAFLKKLSGNGVIGGRSPHKLDSVMFPNTAAPLLVGNHYPTCTDLTHGWVRRLNVFPFDRQFEKHEIDLNRFNTIAATEMPGILNLALEGYGRICQRGRKLLVPDDCLKAAEKFREQSNILLMYTKARLVESPKSHIHLSKIKQDIVSWGQEQGMSIHSPGNNLKGDLENMGYKVGEMDGLNAVKGHRLKT